MQRSTSAAGRDRTDFRILILRASTTWWFWREVSTRSHSELGRENSQRQWYCVLRHGRVGRCQVFQARRHLPIKRLSHAHGFAAGWSSPVARQAHNLKVVGSNPAPATILGEKTPQPQRVAGCFLWTKRQAHINPDPQPISRLIVAIWQPNLHIWPNGDADVSSSASSDGTRGIRTRAHHR